MRTSFTSYLAVLFALIGIGAALPAMASAATIAEIAASNDDFSTLVSVASEVDLVETLSGEGSFTVFAPTNDAFSRLHPRILAVLEDRPDLLREVILYHVLPEEKFAADVLSSKRHETVQGESVRVRTYRGDAYVDRAKITTTDIDADNGVVHVIDRVLIPQDVKREVWRELMRSARHH